MASLHLALREHLRCGPHGLAGGSTFPLAFGEFGLPGVIHRFVEELLCRRWSVAAAISGAEALITFRTRGQFGVAAAVIPSRLAGRKPVCSIIFAA